MHADRHPASFRDPAGHLYFAGGVLQRQVNASYAAHYDLLRTSGLYDELTERGWLIRHAELAGDPARGVHRVLQPEAVPYVSYPYEWCFGQLKDAALLTLDILLASLARGLVLKDASAFNVQFVAARPVFIDTLSFETYVDGRPWVAYRQFCQHFLGPLAVRASTDVRLRALQAAFIDGLPLDLVARLLPWRTRLRYGLLAHLHAHAASQRRFADSARVRPRPAPHLPKARLIALVHSLRATVAGLVLPRARSEWSHYYEDTNYSAEAMAAKEAIVTRFVDQVHRPGDVVHDLGANIGRVSRLLATAGRYVVAHDIDDLAVEASHSAGKASAATSVLPLVLDLANPSPALGWDLEERSASLDRIAGGTVVALALVHHLAISNNVPLERLARFFARLAPALVIEFVPKDDSQVRRLLATRPDTFDDYTLAGFERAFSPGFIIEAREQVPGTQRTIFAMRRRQ